MTQLFYAIRIIAFLLISASTQAELTGYEGECKQVVDRALEQYLAVMSYQDKLTVQKAILRKDSTVMEQIGRPKTIECAFAQPNRLALQGPHLCVYCDGSRYWEYMRQERQYTEHEAPVALGIDEMDLGMVTLQRSHPIVALFAMRKESPESVLSFVKELTEVKSETLDGRAGKRLSGRLEMKYLPIRDKAVHFEAWFSDATGLLGEVRLDLSAVARQVEPIQGMTENDRFLYVLRFDDIRLNESVSPERFVFAPQGGDMLSEAMEAPLSPPQKALIGRAAPPFECQNMAGISASLVQSEGNVVLLYFWRTSCRGCTLQLPQIQQIADAYADKPVSVIAVNSDDAASRERVASFLKDLKMTLSQWLDPAGQIGKQYELSVLPQAVLIDTTGIVRAVYAGQIPVEGICRQIDLLLPRSNEK